MQSMRGQSGGRRPSSGLEDRSGSRRGRGRHCTREPRVALAFPGEPGKIPRRGDPRPAGWSLLIRGVAGNLVSAGATSASDRPGATRGERVPDSPGGQEGRRPSSTSDRRHEFVTVGYLQGWRRSYHETEVHRRRDGPGPGRVRPFSLGCRSEAGSGEPDRPGGVEADPAARTDHQSRSGRRRSGADRAGRHKRPALVGPGSGPR